MSWGGHAMEMFKRWEQNRNLRMHHREKYRAMLEKYREASSISREGATFQINSSLSAHELKKIKTQIKNRVRRELIVKTIILSTVLLMLIASAVWFIAHLIFPLL